MPAAWEARLAALEARLNGIQALCDSLRDMPRMLASIQQKLDLQLGLPSQSSSPTSVPRRPTAPALEQAPTSSAASSSTASPSSPAPAVAVDELSQRMDAQGTVLDRLMDRVDQLAHCFQNIAHHVGGQPHPAAMAPSVRQ